MRPLPFVWPYALIYWGIVLWAFLPERKVVQGGLQGAKRADSKDGSSTTVILFGGGVAYFLAYPAAFVRSWSFPAHWQVPLFVAGMLMLVLGSLLRRYCFRTLGEHFTGDVKASSSQPVIDSGPYRLVRHPSYTAGIMMFAGIGLALGNWLSLGILIVATAATYGYRVSIEERALLDTIGEPYRVYMKERKRFIPYIV
jgi:protein-S-isoprenylcysteine O-methyltransferase Ste14